MARSPLWIAQRHGQNWRDEEALAAIAWMTRSLNQNAWRARLEEIREEFHQGRQAWQQGDRVALFDERDLAAWYLFQANAYAADRADWYEPEAYRLSPVFRRLGQMLPELQMISGAEERAARILTEGRRQPDDGIYELLVAATYRRNGWEKVEFVPEEPGRRKTHDLNVASGRRRWAVECKRVGRSEYAAEERVHGERLAAAVHALSREKQVSPVLEVNFKVELSDVPTEYLADRAMRVPAVPDRCNGMTSFHGDGSGRWLGATCGLFLHAMISISVQAG